MEKLKRFIACVLVVTVVFSAFALMVVFAASAYRIHEMELIVTIPSGYSVITRQSV